MSIMRCNSIRDLYSITSTVSRPTTFTSITPILWHNRLGHLETSILRSLSKNKFIFYIYTYHPLLFVSLVFGKHVKLPNYASSSNTLILFDIVHSDLWTSLTLSTTRHKYYILILDDYSNFLWNFSITKKSQVYSIFLSFSVFIKSSPPNKPPTTQPIEGPTTHMEHENLLALYQQFADFVSTIGFYHSKSNHSLFIYSKGNGMAHILLYVDDIILTASSNDLCKVYYVTPNSTTHFVSSSVKVKYRGVANVISESCWLRNLLLELHCPIHKGAIVYCDNVSAIYLFSNPIQHHCTKHIEMDIHFVREKVARGQVRVLHVPSLYQIANIFTKGISRILFDNF
uniref:Retrovirus-related Pol polyprotein from transposon TNT 1-94 n=1 Tax=Cajanus cajan TaxID=3821 RepID=A0A151SZF6_CAJCA|nr:Retrovirus-related Pol polyprotein from transposon TNT 1-94 [Cajanus cajan]